MHATNAVHSRSRLAARVAFGAIAVCAALGLSPRVACGQRVQEIPVLTVPTGLPPEQPATGLNPLEAALSAALQAAGAAPPGETIAPSAPMAPRGNPFASPVPPPTPGQNLLLPFNPARGAENIAVNDEAEGLISLQVREGSLRQVVAMIAETQKLNIVFAGPGDVTVSASFERQPWQTVLESLTSASGHAWTTQGDIIFVSSLDVADFMPPDAGGQQVHVFELDFASAVDTDQAIKGLLSPVGRSWIAETDPQDNRRTKESVTVADFPAYLERINQYICQADQPPRQVFIQAHILQVELNDSCRNGVNFENIISMSSTPIRLRNVGFANDDATTAFMVNVDGDGENGLDGLIELLQQTTDAKMLASPEISAVSGQFSRMQIGEQLPYRTTATTQTASLQSAQFLDVGVVLEVTPRVTRDGRVLMRIRPEVSTGEYRPEAEGLPSKKTTQLETDVLMSSGEALVLGGLIQEVDSITASKLPFLGNIPYLGILFQKREVNRSRREIIVTLRPFVLPHEPIVDQMQQHKVFRAEQPLTQGAIGSYPRPYEPRLPDVFDHHKKKHEPWLAGEAPAHDGFDMSEGGEFEPIELPDVEDTPGWGIEEIPPGPVLENIEPAGE